MKIALPKDVGPADLAAAVLLSIATFALVAGAIDTGFPHGGIADALLALPMVVPVAWARRAPLNAALVTAAADLVNWLVAGTMVRCGPSLAVTFWIACVAGARLPWRRAAVTLVVLAVGLVGQSASDPNLVWPVPVFVTIVTAGFFVAGRFLRSRSQTVQRLAERNAELAAQRDRTAALAVETERERIATGVESLADARIGQIEQLARAGGKATDPAEAEQAFTAIAAEGRQTLTDMRAVVGSLRDRMPTAPQPGLDDLHTLLGSRLTVTGTPRPVPAAVAVAGYRVVERFLAAAGPGVVVRLAYRPASVELRLSAEGRPAEAELELAAARERLDVIGGSLDASGRTGRVEWTAALPVPA